MDQSDTTEYLNSIIEKKSGAVRDCMIRMLVADLEQNVFRGIVRNSDTEPFTYNLILSYKEYKNDLFPEIKKKFEKRYGGHVLEKGSLSGEQPKTVPGRFFAWYNTLAVGTEYTTAETKQNVRLDKKADLSVYANEAMKTILRRDKVKRGHYIKREA